MQCGWTFVMRMYTTLAKVKQLHFFTKLNKEFQSYITDLIHNDCQILQYIMTVQNITVPVKHWTCLHSLKPWTLSFNRCTLSATQLSHLADFKRYTTYYLPAMWDSYPSSVFTLSDGRMLTRAQNLKNCREAWFAETSKILTTLRMQTAKARLLLFITLLPSHSPCILKSGLYNHKGFPSQSLKCLSGYRKA